MLDLLEEKMKKILCMGQWADGVWNSCHSPKLPLGPIRKLAIFIGSKMHLNMRTTVVALDDLLQQTPLVVGAMTP